MDEKSKIHILILEDNYSDAELIIRKLKKELPDEFTHLHVSNKTDFINALNEFNPGLILSDFELPSLNGLEALKLAREKFPDKPFIIITGSINEETAVKCMKAGAWDYVLKDNLIRLVPAIKSSLEKRQCIKSQKETFEAFKKNERELNTIFNSSPTIIIVISKNREVLKINRTGLELSKSIMDQIIGKSIGFALNCKFCPKDFHCEESMECRHCELKDFIKKCINDNQQSCQTEISIETVKNGKSQTHTYLSYLEKLDNEPEQTFLITLINIDARKDAEKKLVKSEQKFRELADTLPEIVFEVNMNREFIFLNKAAFKKFNLDKSTYTNTKYHISDFIHPSELKRMEMNIKKIIEGQDVSGNDYKTLFPGGKIGYFQIFNSPIFREGELSGLRGIAIDVTERKKIEEELERHREQLEDMVKERTADFLNQEKRLKESQMALSYLLDDVNESREELLSSTNELKKFSLIIEQSPSSVVITNTKGNIEYVNKRFVEISGYSREEVTGKNPRILNSGKHPKEFFKELWGKILAGENWYGEICNKKKNKELYWEYTSISALKDNNNEIINFIAIREDITERKEIENKLKEYNEELEVFNKAMVDRELKIIEMKEEVNNMCLELGKEIKYPPVWNHNINS